MLAYARRVWDEVAAVVEDLRPNALQPRVDQVERTSGMTIGQIFVTHVYGDDSRQLGETEYIKELLGHQSVRDPVARPSTAHFRLTRGRFTEP